MPESLIDKAWKMDITKIPQRIRMDMEKFVLPYGVQELVGTPVRDVPDSTLLFLINECIKCTEREKALAILWHRLREYEFYQNFE